MSEDSLFIIMLITVIIAAVCYGIGEYGLKTMLIATTVVVSVLFALISAFFWLDHHESENEKLNKIIIEQSSEISQLEKDKKILKYELAEEKEKKEHLEQRVNDLTSYFKSLKKETQEAVFKSFE